MDIMEKVVLKATRRTLTGRQVNAMRRQGQLPAVMYGHHFEATPITLDLRDTTRLLSKLTHSSLVTVNLDGEDHIALVQEKQRDVITQKLLHVDFWAVSLTEKVHTSVGIEFIGVSPAVKNFNGFVTVGIEELEVQCFPQDLPEKITVDLSNLDKIGSSIHVRDLVLGNNVELLTEADLMVVMITAAAVVEEEVVVPVEGALEPEVIEKVRKEEEEEEKK
jgi:large subunit ribosomal protein L25